MKTSIRLILIFVLGAGVYSPAVSAYNFPTESSGGKAFQGSADMTKISKGVADLSDYAKKALVFVSIEKNISYMNQENPLGGFPWEFFGIPNPYKNSPQQPRGRRAPQERRERRVPSGLGSGFIVDLDKGYIITNNHVVEQADVITLKLANGATYDGNVVGTDPRTDVAIVQIKNDDFNKTGLSELVLGDSNKVRVGELAIALGAPFGLETSISLGIISAIGRDDLHITDFGSFIQTDAAINPGNSGGPLIDDQGEVIGMNTAIYSKSGGYNGIGFAVPSNVVRSVAESLINKGRVERGFLGITMADIDSESLQDLGLPKHSSGVLVAEVQPDSPAEKSGLKPDDVITKIDNKRIKNMITLKNIIAFKKPGAKVSIEYFRDGKKKDAEAILTLNTIYLDQDNQRLGKNNQKNEPAKGHGFGLTKLNNDLKKQYGLENNNGVLITSIQPRSSAANSELKEGDLILSIDGTPVSSPKDVEKIFENKKNKRFLVRFERTGEVAYQKVYLD